MKDFDLDKIREEFEKSVKECDEISKNIRMRAYYIGKLKGYLEALELIENFINESKASALGEIETFVVGGDSLELEEAIEKVQKAREKYHNVEKVLKLLRDLENRVSRKIEEMIDKTRDEALT